MTFKSKFPLFSIVALLAGLAAAPTYAGGMVPVYQAIKDAAPLVNMRLRYEGVEQDGKQKDANSITLRSRIGIETGAVYDTKLLVEFENIAKILDNYNDTINGQVQYPVVADPDDTQINRLQLVNTSLPDTKVTIGRQRIILDNARFVGNVGWRQNEQTFDAVRIENNSIKNLSLDVSYVDQVNRIFGTDSPKGTFDSDSVFATAKYKVPMGSGKFVLEGFAYLLDFEDAKAASSQTYGGTIDYWKGDWGVKATYAVQSDYADQPTVYDNDYYWIEGAYKAGDLKVMLGYEVLEGDGAIGFAAPLATAHAFNGYADIFLNTPVNGLEDIYAKAVYKLDAFGPFDGGKLIGIYHDFSAENTSLPYGTEIDLIAVLNRGPLSFVAKYAGYDKDKFATDTDRLWLQIDFDLGKFKS